MFRKHSLKTVCVTLAMALTVAVPLESKLYINDFYPASPAAMEVLSSPAAGVTVTETPGRCIAFVPDSPTAAVVFYPGGKVQYEAYAPLMNALAERGILCVLLHMPGNLAVLDVNAAEGIPAQYPAVDDWYLAGHSLGGSMAAVHLDTHTTDYRGVIFLSAYSTKDLTDSGMKVLSLYGSEDGVLGMDAYNRNHHNLPTDAVEAVISGGCHAFFGDYGPQRGDGTPTITVEEQTRQTADAITAFIAEK